MALLKSLTKEKKPAENSVELERELLAECMKDQMVFSFYRKLPAGLLSPYQLDDKVYVECHAHPDAKVTLCYTLDTGLGNGSEYHMEPLKNIYEGIFVKTFTLFYGESLRYYFTIEMDDKTKKTAERVITAHRVEETPQSKFQLLNHIMADRHLGKEKEALSRMQQYLRQEQYIREMFTIEKESEQ
jgi:hypothetical protein